MNVQCDEHKCVLELLQKIACSKWELVYHELFEQFVQFGLRFVIAYYNWNSSHHQ